MQVYRDVTELIGQTPIVKLQKITPEGGAEIYTKLEFLNPGGSVKDRIALKMIEEAERQGKLKPGGTIVEPTSGNTGIGLAMVGAVKGYRVIVVMPEYASWERRQILAAFGAEVVLTPAEQGTSGAVAWARKLVEENPHYFLPNQFENPVNPQAHRETTAQEILQQMGKDLHGVVVGVGTGGTITGIAEGLKPQLPEVKIIAVEPKSSALLSGGQAGSHRIPGIGPDFIPPILNRDLIDEVIPVRDEEAFAMTRRLAREEGILAGISSGAVVWAALQLAQRWGRGKKILALLADSGDRYFSTGVFS